MMIKNKNKAWCRCMMSFIFMCTLGTVKADKKEVLKIDTKETKESNVEKSKQIPTTIVKSAKLSTFPLNKTNLLTSADDKEKEKRTLELNNSLMKVRWEHQYADLIAEVERLRLEKEYKRLCKEIEEGAIQYEHERTIRLLNMQKEKLVAELELAQAKFNRQMLESSTQLAAFEKKAQLSRAETQLLQEDKNRLQAEIDALRTEVKRSKYIKKKPIYLQNPVRKKDNVLVLSDRCIRLNGFIRPWVANKVVDQIHYFNNVDTTYPIFIIIEESPGGCVMSGFHIIQAIKHSKAPVYVVLKRFAASMAACIVTLATKSYALPNAQLLHHQPSWGAYGNTRDFRECSKKLDEMWKRTGGLVAKKMGISLNKFEKKMYEKSVKGDWEEYADVAKKLKWVDEVIDGIEESNVSVMPNSDDYTLNNWFKEYFGYLPFCGRCIKGDNEEEKGGCNAIAPYDYDYNYYPFKGGRSDIEQYIKSNSKKIKK